MHNHYYQVSFDADFQAALKMYFNDFTNLMIFLKNISCEQWMDHIRHTPV